MTGWAGAAGLGWAKIDLATCDQNKKKDPNARSFLTYSSNVLNKLTFQMRKDEQIQVEIAASGCSVGVKMALSSCRVAVAILVCLWGSGDSGFRRFFWVVDQWFPFDTF